MKSITPNQQVMKKGFFLLIFLFLLNGCAESVALLGSSVGGASSGKMVQSSLNSAISYGIKQQTGKGPIQHVIAYAEKINPEKEKEPCLSFVKKIIDLHNGTISVSSELGKGSEFKIIFKI